MDEIYGDTRFTSVGGARSVCSSCSVTCIILYIICLAVLLYHYVYHIVSINLLLFSVDFFLVLSSDLKLREDYHVTQIGITARQYASRIIYDYS